MTYLLNIYFRNTWKKSKISRLRIQLDFVWFLCVYPRENCASRRGNLILYVSPLCLASPPPLPIP